MKFNKVIKEAMAELVGDKLDPNNLMINLGGKGIKATDMASQAPYSWAAIKKSLNYAKKKGINISKNRQPADITLKGDGSVVITDDIYGKKYRVEPKQLGFDDKQITAMKNEIGA